MDDGGDGDDRSATNAHRAGMTTYVTPVLDPGMPELIETGANAHVLCVEVPLTDSEKRVLR